MTRIIIAQTSHGPEVRELRLIRPRKAPVREEAKVTCYAHDEWRFLFHQPGCESGTWTPGGSGQAGTGTAKFATPALAARARLELLHVYY